MQRVFRESSPMLRDWRGRLDVDWVLRGQGADPTLIRSRNPSITKFAECALAEGMPLLNPRVIYRRLPVSSVGHGRIALRGGGLLTGKLVAVHLAGAEEVVLIAATIGERLEDFASQILKRNAAYGLALDGFGTAAIETLAAATCQHFSKAAARKGWKSTVPLGPGMVDWPLEVGQKQVFALLDAEKIGLRLTSSSLMVPRKSVSMVVGLGPQVTRGGGTCAYCDKRATCRYQDHYEIAQLQYQKTS